MLKIYMLIIVVGLLGGVVYGAYAYYQDTQQRIATLQQNNAKLETVAKTRYVRSATLRAKLSNCCISLEELHGPY